MPTAFLFALAVAATAAIADSRHGVISNWITLPPLVAAPIGYFSALGLNGAVTSIVAALVCGVVPYAVFRSGGMGGGDVKLFAALGATTGFDIATGIEIQLASLTVASLVAVCVLFRRWLHRDRGTPTPSRSTQSVRSINVKLGFPVLLGTAMVCLGRFAEGRAPL